MTAAPDSPARPSWLDAMAVYLKPRVLIVLLLGFSAGLPFSLAGQTLQAWMTESGVDIKTIGLFAAVGTPYWAKPLWAPAVDALDIPLLSRLLGRRRAWLILTQLMLVVSVILLALCEPAISPWLVAGAALLVTTASATQDIVIDAFRIESLPENEQAAGMASYVAAYRIAVLISGAGALFLVTGFIQLGLDKQAAYHATYITMATLIGVGIAATLLAKEPDRSAAAESAHTAHSREKSWKRVWDTAITSFAEFLSRDMAISILAFVTLFKFADSLASALTTPFVLETGFTPDRACRHHQGCWICRSDRRRLCWRFCGAGFADVHELVDRRNSASSRYPGLFVAGGRGPGRGLAHLRDHRRKLHKRDRNSDFCRVSFRALRQSVAHGDPVCLADGPIRVGANRVRARLRLCRRGHRLGMVFRDLHRSQHTKLHSARLVTGRGAFQGAGIEEILEQGPLLDGRRERAFVEVIEFATDRHTVCKPRHFHIRILQ